MGFFLVLVTGCRVFFIDLGLFGVELFWQRLTWVGERNVFVFLFYYYYSPVKNIQDFTYFLVIKYLIFMKN